MGKLLGIIGVIVAWFILGGIINFLAYSNKPSHLNGTSQTAKTLHILINIGAVIAFIAVLVS